MRGKDLLPALDEALRNGLGADVHEAPLIEHVGRRIDLALLDGKQDVLHPGNKQPDDGAMFIGDRIEDALRRYAAQEHGL